jgi:hypothetical protein
LKIDSLDPNGDIPDDQHSITIYPGVRDDDLREVNKQFQKELRKRAKPYKPTNENLLDYSWSPQLKFRDEPSKPTIIQSRNWYLVVKVNKSKTIVELADDLNANCPIKEEHKSRKEALGQGLVNCQCFDESTVRKSIVAYEILLRKKLLT